MRNPNYIRKTKKNLSVGEYIEGIETGDIQILSLAITLIESKNYEDRKIADHILSQIKLPKKHSIRLGFTGSPGVGKSTLIEAYGLHLLNQEKKIAILAIDPSSQESKGSLLGDKTRMKELGQSDNVYIRPTPAGSTLGGVAQYTREAIMLCDAAGFEYIIIETVGVGQSETYVKQLCDIFVLLLLPGSGDELQGIKRGIVELADLVVITKSEDDRIQIAKDTKRHFRNALMLSRRSTDRKVDTILVSAIQHKGIDLLGSKIEELRNNLNMSGGLVSNRKEQDLFWFKQNFEYLLYSYFMSKPQNREAFERIENELISDNINLVEALTQLKEFMHGA